MLVKRFFQKLIEKVKIISIIEEKKSENRRFTHIFIKKGPWRPLSFSC